MSAKLATMSPPRNRMPSAIAAEAFTQQPPILDFTYGESRAAPAPYDGWTYSSDSWAVVASKKYRPPSYAPVDDACLHARVSSL